MSFINQDPPIIWFLSELEKSLAKERLRLSDDARMYLSTLLARVDVDQRGTKKIESEEEIESEKGKDAPDTLASAFALALQQEGTIRDGLLRGVGNSALLLCGLWWHSVEYEFSFRHGIDRDYQQRIGRTAFGRIDDDLFQELSHNFIGVVDVFARIGEKIATDQSVQTIRMYESFLRTKNRLAEKFLREQGLILPIGREPVQ